MSVPELVPPPPSDLEVLYLEAERAYEVYWRGDLMGYTREYIALGGKPRWEFMVALHKSGARYGDRETTIRALWAYHFRAPTRWGKELRQKYEGTTLR